MANGGDWYVDSQTITAPPFAGPNDPSISLGPDIPAELQTFYGGFMVAVVIYRTTSTRYKYSGITTGQYVEGTVENGVVAELFNQSFGFVGSAAQSYGDRNNYSLQLGGSSASNVLVQGPTFQIGTLSPWRVDGVSYARGLLGYVQSTGASPGITAETVVLSVAITLNAGRAMRVAFNGETDSNVAGDVAVYTIRRTNLAGAQKGNQKGYFTSTAALIFVTTEFEVVLRNTGGGAINDNVVLTLFSFSGNVVQLAAGAALTVTDIGAASDYPNAVVF